MAKLSEEGMCLGPENSRGLNRHWYEVVCSSQLNVLCRFSPLHLVCHSTCFSGGQLQVRWSKSARGGSVPDTGLVHFYTPSLLPVRPFPICSADPRWFQVGRNLVCCQRPRNEVIDRHATGMVAKALLAMETVGSLPFFFE